MSDGKSHFAEIKEMPLWSQCIGGLIINFGGTEALTFIWIHKLAGESPAIKARKDTLSDRIKFIVEFIPTSKLSDSDKEKAIGLWNEIKIASAIRNRIAHNPINIARRPNGDEVVLTISDLKKMTPNSENPIEELSYSKIGNIALRVREINLSLDSLLKSIPCN
jgi:hypothetical protein